MGQVNVVKMQLAAASFVKFVMLCRANPTQGFCCHNTSFRWEVFITLCFPQKQEGASKWKEKRLVP